VVYDTTVVGGGGGGGGVRLWHYGVQKGGSTVL